MALVLADRVKETTTTAGTGTVTLLGASSGFQSFAVVGDANTTYYTIAGQTTSEWEVGIGTYTSSGTTLARTTVLSNSAGTQPTALTFSAGTKDVFVTYPSSKSVNQDASGNVGIGTTSPTAKLDVSGTAKATNMSLNGVAIGDYNLYSGMVTRVSNGGGVGINSANSSDNAYIYFGSGTSSAAQQSAAIGRIGGDVLGMFTASSERMRITSTGGVSFGATGTAYGTSGQVLTSAGNAPPTWTTATSANTASAIVQRDASGNFTAGTITAALTGNASGSAATFTSTSQNSQFNSVGVGTAGSGTAGEIRATNNITAYYSDDRLKTRLGDIQDALAKVKTLSGFYYEANQTAQDLGYDVVREVGVSAQQVQAVLPEIVVPAPIDEKYWTVRYEKMIPLLIEAIKELEVRLAALESKK